MLIVDFMSYRVRYLKYAKMDESYRLAMKKKMGFQLVSLGRDECRQLSHNEGDGKFPDAYYHTYLCYST